MARSTRIVLTAVAALLAAGCSGAPGTAPPGGPDPAPPPARTVVPTAWLDAAAAAWPGSDGSKNRVMVFGGARQCALGDQRVHVRDAELRWSGSGYGPVVPGAAGVYGQQAPGAAAGDGFVHLCRLSLSRTPSAGVPSRAAGDVVLTRYPDAAALRSAVAGFRNQRDTPVQDNEVGPVTSGRYGVDVLRRWYPTNPQGAYQAMVVDEPQRATVVLELNSLSRHDFDALSAQQAADVLTDFLERSHTAPPAAPPPVPAWADSVWQDDAGTFHIAVAKGWAHDPGAGDTLPRFVTPDRSASTMVLPLPTAEPVALPEAVRRFRTAAEQRGFTVVGDEPITLDDGRAAERLDTAHAGKRLTTVLVVTDEELFQVLGSAPADRWDGVQDDVLRMARSLVVES
jgi:hypothetical protein